MSYGYSQRIVKSNSVANPTLIGVDLGRVCIRYEVPVTEVSEALGVSRQTVYNWFIGRCKPKEALHGAIEKLIGKYVKPV